MLTSDSLIKIGRYKNKKKLNEIPIEYFSQFYRSHVSQDYENKPDIKGLMIYIETVVGIKTFGFSNYQTALYTALNTMCPKEFFINEGDAKYRLDSIRKNQTKHNKTNKIPVRSYECERCGYWHLTSQPSRYDLAANDILAASKQETTEDSYQPTMTDKWLKLMQD